MRRYKCSYSRASHPGPPPLLCCRRRHPRCRVGGARTASATTTPQTGGATPGTTQRSSGRHTPTWALHQAVQLVTARQLQQRASRKWATLLAMPWLGAAVQSQRRRRPAPLRRDPRQQLLLEMHTLQSRCLLRRVPPLKSPLLASTTLPFSLQLRRRCPAGRRSQAAERMQSSISLPPRALPVHTAFCLLGRRTQGRWPRLPSPLPLPPTAQCRRSSSSPPRPRWGESIPSRRRRRCPATSMPTAPLASCCLEARCS